MRTRNNFYSQWFEKDLMLRKNYETKSYYVIRTKIKIMMSKSKRTIIKTVFLLVFIITGIFNVSGQAKADKLDKLISAYTE